MKINSILAGIGIATLLMAGCKPKIAKDKSLPEPAQADFSSTTYLDPADPDRENFQIFSNTTPGGFISKWDFGGTKSSILLSDTAFFAFEGKYNVTLTSASKGGLSSVTKEVRITKTSPLASSFKVTPLTETNKYEVRVLTTGGNRQKFFYANADTSAAAVDTVYFPFQGKYDISLQYFFKKGSSTFSSISTQTITVDNDDPNNPDLKNQVFLDLTGGLSAKDGKTWVLNNYIGVGDRKNKVFNFTSEVNWDKNKNGITGPQWADGAAANEYTFNIRQYMFSPKNKKATVHYAAANAFFGKSQAQYQDIALEDPNLKAAPFLLRPDTNVHTPINHTLLIGYNNYLGYHQNRSYYEIIKLNADTLYVRQPYNDIVTDPASQDGGGRYLLYTAKK